MVLSTLKESALFISVTIAHPITGTKEAMITTADSKFPPILPAPLFQLKTYLYKRLKLPYDKGRKIHAGSHRHVAAWTAQQ
jgi:hypothetical protein